jgi:hypothetical protein
MGWLRYQNKEKKMDFTILYDDKAPEFVSGNTIQDIYLNLEQTGADYVEVIPGRRNVSAAAVKQFKNDPTAVLLSQIKDKPVAISAKQENADIQTNPVVNDRHYTPPPPSQPAQYFEDGGNEYKLENNVMYRKTWTDCDSARIIHNKTGKPYTGDAYKVQTQEWKKVAPN